MGTTQTFASITEAQHAWAADHGMVIEESPYNTGWTIELINPPSGYESLYVSVSHKGVSLCGYRDNEQFDRFANFMRLGRCETVKQGVKELLMRGAL